MSAERLLAVVGLIVSFLLLVRFGPAAWRAVRILGGVRRRRMADAGPLEIPPPEAVAGHVPELTALGFRRIGERWLRLPGTPVRFEWVFGEPSGETYVVMLPSFALGGILAACFTSWDDGTWVQTNYPRGAVVEREQLRAAVVATSLPDAIAAHRRTVDRYRGALGRPRAITTMADTLRMDADYRSRHGGSTLGVLTARVMAPAAGALVLVVVFALILVVAR